MLQQKNAAADPEKICAEWRRCTISNGLAAVTGMTAGDARSLISLSYCLTPLMAEPIISFVSRGGAVR